MEELAALVELIERLHVDGPSSEWDRTELHDCVGYSEGLACCLERIRESPEFAAAKRALP